MAPQSYESTDSLYVQHNVTHCPQRRSWDCGVTCVMMLLSAEDRKHLQDNFDRVCQEEGFGQSTWTIDLCYLLKRYGISSCLYTTTPGVNEGHRNEKYYSKILDKDRERVTRRFAECAGVGVGVEVRPALSEEGLWRAAQRAPLLVLVDASQLVCDLCKLDKLRTEFRRMVGASGGYRGHYVVVVGVARGRVLYLDPARWPRRCECSRAALHRARAAPATDRDLVLPYLTPDHTTW